MATNYIPPTPTKERDGAIYYYCYVLLMIILLPLWIFVFLLDVIFNFTGFGRGILSQLFKRHL